MMKIGILCMGDPSGQETSMYPPGLGQHEDSPQHQGLFFLLSFGRPLLWMDEPDSHLHWWEVGQVSGWEPLPSSCQGAGDHGHRQWPSGNQAEIQCKVLSKIWHGTIPIHSIYNLVITWFMVFLRSINWLVTVGKSIGCLGLFSNNRKKNCM